MSGANAVVAPARRGSGSDVGERIELELESLEFEGIEVAEPRRVQAALEAELTRLIRDKGLPDRASRGAAEEASFDGGELTVADLSNPERLGQAVARHVYAELTR
jgi:hypothetical protein